MDGAEIEFRIKRLKEKVTSLVEQKNMISIMNNTKWLELQRSVRELPFLPPFEIKYVTDINEPESFG